MCVHLNTLAHKHTVADQFPALNYHVSEFRSFVHVHVTQTLLSVFVCLKSRASIKK